MNPPDFNELLKVLRCEVPSRPVLFEFFMDLHLHRRLLGMEAIPEGAYGINKLAIDGFHKLGYDYANCYVGFTFPKGEREAKSSLSQSGDGLITDWASFESYQWPVVADNNYETLDRLGRTLPDGMKIMLGGPGGVLENLVDLVGFEALCIMFHDDPDLVRAVVDGIGSRLVEHYQIACEFDCVGLIMSNDDWGFKTQTMLSPELMREYIIPWHKRIVNTAHGAGRPCVLHSCGNLELLMDDIIDDIGYDGKHSYEDAILPVEEAHERYGDRIAILGGIDVDFLCRAELEDITARSRGLVDRAMEKGSYALGSGNSIPNWVPEENFFAMIEAAGLQVRK